MKKNIIFLLLIFASCSFLGRPPTDIVILLPENGASWQEANVQMIWQSENAEIFRLYFGENQDSLEMIAEQTASAYEMTGLSPRTTYFWKVIAENNVATKETSIYSFSTGTKPDAVNRLNLPDSGSIANEPNVPVSWEQAEYADSYFVEISTDTLFINLFMNQMFDDTYAVHRDFYPNKRYYWRVRSWNSFGPADWSPVAWFDIIEYIPK